ncbi:3'-5' exonuclease [Acinetobacter sp. P1(2025)]|uniref:3'-5' exonuclease n=1 Tax=Acinetobacter sp. P1(2025) TaxID=3446120 RepID=UPI003F52F3F0
MAELSKDVREQLSELVNKPTPEQENCLAHALDMQPFKMTAYAGTGKTSTLTIVSKVLGKKGLKGLYIAFNKSIAVEASSRFDPSVKCVTFNALAFRSVPIKISTKIKNPRNYPKQLAEIYGLSTEYCKYSENHLQEIKNRSLKSYYNVIEQGSKNRVTGAMKMQIVNEAIFRYCKSDSKEITLDHFRCPDWMNHSDFDFLSAKLLPVAQNRWNDLISTDNAFNIPHDVYVKYWALTDPQISGYDYIMMDEVQDADKLMSAILQSQKTPVFYVGDSHQSIYGFRGAINTIKNLDLKDARLTQSFRFGEQIANYANSILSLLGETTPLIGNPKVESGVYLQHGDGVEVDAILCRTNKGAFSEFMLQTKLNPDRKFAMVADIKEIRSWLEAAQMLQDKKTVNHPDLSFFTTWDEVLEYTQLNKADNDFNYMVSLLDHFGNDFKQLFSILNNLNENEDDADTVISTIHKSKGREWDRVLLSSDFNLELMTDKFAGINNRAESLASWKSENPNVYIENWEIVDFPESLTLYPRENEVIEGQLEKYLTLNPKMAEQRFRIMDILDEELRLIYVAVTRAKKALYAKNLTDFFVLIKKLEENLD